MLHDATKKAYIEKLESMPFEEARRKIRHGELGSEIGSPNHAFFLSWLDNKEAELHEKHQEKSLSISRKALFTAQKATRIAIIAIIFSIIMVILEIFKQYLT